MGVVYTNGCGLHVDVASVQVDDTDITGLLKHIKIMTVNTCRGKNYCTHVHAHVNHMYSHVHARFNIMVWNSIHVFTTS